MKQSFKDYISEKNLNKLKYNIGNIFIDIKKPFSADLNHKAIITNTLNKIPKHLINNIKKITVGEFEFLKSRSLDASYIGGTIFISNNQLSEIDLSGDIIHEIAHSIEKEYRELIFSDNSLKKEFLQKRIKLYNIMKNNGYKITKQDFLNHKYNVEFDSYLYKKVKYSNLDQMVSGIYIDSYSVTSLSEYFATGFEKFFMNQDIQIIKNTCPVLYLKLTNLLQAK